ncbi:MAG: type IV toxin-antitoxin system AbiEi family antitoxin [Bacteroidales bacterium]|nr:type IV toxin-antitoxin system AbiEi family antitoxin [Bacteroidales bacterium]
MSTNNQTKINLLLQSQPSGVVFLASWLETNGYSRDLQRRYIKSGWLRPIGRGALVRTGQNVNWLGALHAIQNQAKSKIHIGGRSALNIHGLAHYLEMEEKKRDLFAPRGTFLPSWFINFDWGLEFILHKTDFLPDDAALVAVEVKNFTVMISSPTRALMECLYLAPREFNLLEAYQIMEGLTALRPVEVQFLLSKCNSVKIARLFLYLAVKARHSWVKHLDMSKVDIGKGKRSIVTDGVFIPDFQITIPSDLAKA